ncbi:MAG TPA: hypothetical protein VGC42_02475 [Kofleriaceae bacterium]
MTEPVPPSKTVDLPPVPRPKLSKLAIALGVFGVLVTGAYSAMAFTDFEPGAAERDEIPASVRSSPGGYRSFHFWHSGYHGGK